MTTHFDTVRKQLTIGEAGRVLRSGEPTPWTIVRRGSGRFRAVVAGTVTDDRCSCSQDAELDRLAERIAADECDATTGTIYAEYVDGQYVAGDRWYSTDGDNWCGRDGRPVEGDEFARSKIVLRGGPRDGHTVA